MKNELKQEPSAIKTSMSNFSAKCKDVEPKYWVNIVLWILTLLALIAVIVVSAMKGEITKAVGGDEGYSNVIAGVVLGFSVLLIASIIQIVSIKLIQKRKGSK